MSDDESPEKVGSQFMVSVKLLPGEVVIRQSLADRERFVTAPKGLLCLTNQRLIFCPYRYMLSWSAVTIPLGEIVDVGEKQMSFLRRLVDFFALHAWYVRTRHRRYIFWSPEEETETSCSRADWLRAVATLVEQAREQNS